MPAQSGQMANTRKENGKSTQMVDGFDYEDSTEGEDLPASSGLIVGEKIKFNSPDWLGRDDKKLPPLLLVVLRLRRVVQKWSHEGKPIEGHTRILEPHEKWPDIAALKRGVPAGRVAPSFW